MTISHTSRSLPRDFCLGPSRALDLLPGAGRYRRLFPELDALRSDEALLQRLGVEGGACDGTPGARGSGASPTDSSTDDADVAAGWPFFGQYLAHDLTADRSAPVHQADPERLRNARRLQLDLECLYGGGPSDAPFLFDRDDSATFLLGVNDRGLPDDALRNPQGTAVIPDPRNDSQTIISQLHVAFVKAHNGIVARLRSDGASPGELFSEARRALLRHYHWIIVNEFLPQLIGSTLTEELMAAGPRYYHPAQEALFIPLEFADAAYRYGHSQIRHAYRLNDECAPVPMFPDLLGFRPVPASRTIDWRLFFDAPGTRTAQRAKRIDGRLPAALIRLPQAITGDVGQFEAAHSLAVRDLQRGHALGLPSGEAVARHLGVDPISPDEVGLGAYHWRGETPLWYYVLRESAIRGGGNQLGPVGGRIVGEVMIGVLHRDPEFYGNADPSWQPTLPSRLPGQFTLADLLEFATRRDPADVRGA